MADGEPRHSGGDARHSGDEAMREAEEVQRLPLKWDGPTRIKTNARVNTYCEHRILNVVRVELEKCGMLDRFRATCFGHFLRFDWNFVFSGKLFLALMSKEVVVPDSSPYVRVFEFENRRCTFSKLEYCMFTGLRFGASSFNPEVAHEIPEGGIYNRRWRLQSVVVSELASDFDESAFNDNPEDALKVACILVATVYLLAQDDRMAIPNWMWALVEDEAAFNSFPWGAYIFQRSMMYLDRGLQPTAAGVPKNLYHMYGYISPLQLWALECFPDLAAALGDKANDEFPRGVRWKCPGRRPNIPDIIYRRDIRIVDVRPTQHEREMAYMVDIDIDLLAGIQYVHHERTIGFRRKIGEGRQLMRSDTARAREEARKKARVDAPSPTIPHSLPSHPPPPPPPPPFHQAGPSGPPPPPPPPPPAGLDVPASPPPPHSMPEISGLREMIKGILREVLPEVMRELLPDFVRELNRQNVNPPQQENVNSPPHQDSDHESRAPEGVGEFSPTMTPIRCPSPQRIEYPEPPESRGRVRMRSHLVRTPYMNPEALRIQKMLEKEFNDFMSKDDMKTIPYLGRVVGKDYFADIMSATSNLGTDHLSCYMGCLATRLREGDGILHGMTSDTLNID